MTQTWTPFRDKSTWVNMVLSSLSPSLSFNRMPSVVQELFFKDSESIDYRKMNLWGLSVLSRTGCMCLQDGITQLEYKLNFYFMSFLNCF